MDLHTTLNCPSLVVLWTFSACRHPLRRQKIHRCKGALSDSAAVRQLSVTRRHRPSNYLTGRMKTPCCGVLPAPAGSSNSITKTRYAPACETGS